jgi:hypothetical protein
MKSIMENLQALELIILEIFGVEIKGNLKMTLDSLSPVSEDVNFFFIEFSKKFKVNMSEYSYYDYFFEQVSPILSFKERFLSVFRANRRKRKISINHLLLVIEKRHWFVPEE